MFDDPIKWETSSFLSELESRWADSNKRFNDVHSALVAALEIQKVILPAADDQNHPRRLFQRLQAHVVSSKGGQRCLVELQRQRTIKCGFLVPDW